MKIACSIFVFIISAGAAILFLVNAKERQDAAALAFDNQPKPFCVVVYPEGHIPYDELSDEAKVRKQLFNANCAACHKLDRVSTGPFLRNINERYTTEDIIKFIRNDFSGALKYSGERGYKCTLFPNLSDEDIQSILAYTN